MNEVPSIIVVSATVGVEAKRVKIAWQGLNLAQAQIIFEKLKDIDSRGDV